MLLFKAATQTVAQTKVYIKVKTTLILLAKTLRENYMVPER